MRHGSLFSGIGGFDLAAQWMGWENFEEAEAKLNKHFDGKADEKLPLSLLFDSCKECGENYADEDEQVMIFG